MHTHCARMHTCIDTCTHAHTTHMNTHTTHTCGHKHTYAHTHTYAHRHTHTAHTHVQRYAQVSRQQADTRAHISTRQTHVCTGPEHAHTQAHICVGRCTHIALTQWCHTHMCTGTQGSLRQVRKHAHIHGHGWTTQTCVCTLTRPHTGSHRHPKAYTITQRPTHAGMHTPAHSHRTPAHSHGTPTQGGISCALHREGRIPFGPAVRRSPRSLLLGCK